ncbi:putative two-component response regulator-like APRR5-like [Haematococcus lacustris]|uniref:Putative two-component response regulator-like APRR5-like n=1 Tax=Haematococcus lacustris TaxID=44745 RepID=A0A6A0A7R4_HAELA|nr:putative two-component response regulator-like APRR5-like [Haematococcus lacustris]
MSSRSSGASTSYRQAALQKYLIKKKNRSVHKKVRYESRKRLAEARPRVRGQFVKQEVLAAQQAGEQRTTCTPPLCTSPPSFAGSAAQR